MNEHNGNGTANLIKRYYTTKDLAKFVGRSVKWGEKWRHEIIGAERLGRTWLFDMSVIATLIR